MTAEILIVDDDTSHRRMLEAVLNGEGYAVTHAEDGLAAVDAVSDRYFDLILLDIRMSRMDGIEALHRIREISPGIPVIIMTAYATVDTAVDALKSGASDYITKPLDIDELKILVKKAMRYQKLEEENRFLRERLGTQFDFANIVGESPPMKRLFETISLVAPSDATVLIYGESGTGKELIANAIHQNSSRRDRPFIKVNCAALPEPLLESELFGHEKGAFTGAAQKKQGRFQLAHTGSIFLDEIAETAPSTQVKLLRVLQEQEFEPLGSTRSVKVDIRVIAATNRDMALEIRDGRFREDLFYRLNVVAVTLPPLRDRRGDIVLLAEHFLGWYAKKNRRLIKRFTPRSVDLLMRHPWPGNVRELENAVERAVILCRGDAIAPDDLPDTVCSPADGEKETDTALKPGLSLKEMEKQMILRTLEETEGNRTHAAEILGISRRTLQNKLKEYGINP